MIDDFGFLNEENEENEEGLGGGTLKSKINNRQSSIVNQIDRDFSLDVLDLFSDFFDLGFGLDYGLRDLRVVGF